MRQSQHSRPTRRALLAAGAPMGAGLLLGLPERATASDPPLYKEFPSQDPKLVRDTVLYSHSDADQVAALVKTRPALANAAVDWGFGDWETALGAASHMGRRDIADVLLSNGARPDLFTNAMLGNLVAVQGTIQALPGIQRQRGPHGITLLAHARAGGDGSTAVVAYLESLGDADPSYTTAPLPWPEDAYVGHYRFGRRDTDTFEIVSRRGQLGFRRGEAFLRTLFHVGDSEFHPTGAPSVRIRFVLEGERAVVAGVYDPELAVEGTRITSAAP